MSNISEAASDNQNEPSFVSEVNLNQFFVARFTPDQDLFDSLKELMREKGLERLLVMSGIGSFKNITMRDLKLGIEKPVNLDKTNEIISETSEVLKRLPDLPAMVDKANDVITLIAEGKFNPNTLAYRSLIEEELKLKLIRNKMLVGILVLVIIVLLVFK